MGALYVIHSRAIQNFSVSFDGVPIGPSLWMASVNNRAYLLGFKTISGHSWTSSAGATLGRGSCPSIYRWQSVSSVYCTSMCCAVMTFLLSFKGVTISKISKKNAILTCKKAWPHYDEKNSNYSTSGNLCHP